MTSDESTVGDHRGREPENWRDDIPDETLDFLDDLEASAAEADCDVAGCLTDARHETPTGRVLCPGHWKEREAL